MKKVLFIACLYPPIANSGTQRSVKFANYLPDYGWVPIVLTVETTTEQALEPALLKEIRPATRIERVPFWSNVLATRIGRALSAILPERRVIEGIEWRLRSLWSVPDQWAFWRTTAVKRALEIYNDEGFDCIYATGFPWTSFLVAKEVSVKSGKPYVLDFRDLWCSWKADWNASLWFADWYAKRLELSVINKASAIVTTTDAMARVLVDMLPTSAQARVTCITNGYDPEDFFVEPEGTKTIGKIRIVYTGVWKVGYSPKVLYEAIMVLQRNFPAELSRLEVVCAGFTPGEFGEKSLDNTVQELGRVSHCDAIALMKSADALFLPVSEGDYALGSLPGKLFEYLASGKPIIAAVPEDSEVAKILNLVGGAARVDPGDVSALTSLLVDIAQTGGPAWGTPEPSQTVRFERRNLTSQLAEVLTSVSMVR